MAGGTAHVEIDKQGQVKLTGQVEAVASGIFAPNLVAKFLS
jgi:hypothetical protein